MSEQLHVFTTGSALDLLRRSCEDVMITLHTFPDPRTTLVDIKIHRVIEYLAEVREPYCMWVDGNDSLVTRGEKDILLRLPFMPPGVIIAAEAFCYPDASMDKFFPATEPPRFLNSGGFIGPTRLVLESLHVVRDYIQGDNDQLAWALAYVGNDLPHVFTDSNRRFFSCVFDGVDGLLADSCVKHWNGRAPGREDYYRALKASRKS